jgi:hypothetical protein
VRQTQHEVESGTDFYEDSPQSFFFFCSSFAFLLLPQMGKKKEKKKLYSVFFLSIDGV